MHCHERSSCPHHLRFTSLSSSHSFSSLSPALISPSTPHPPPPVLPTAVPSPSSPDARLASLSFAELLDAIATSARPNQYIKALLTHHPSSLTQSTFDALHSTAQARHSLSSLNSLHAFLLSPGNPGLLYRPVYLTALIEATAGWRQWLEAERLFMVSVQRRWRPPVAPSGRLYAEVRREVGLVVPDIGVYDAMLKALMTEAASLRTVATPTTENVRARYAKALRFADFLRSSPLLRSTPASAAESAATLSFTLTTFNLLLTLHTRCEQWPLVDAVYARLLSTSLQPDAVTRTAMLRASHSQGLWTDVLSHFASLCDLPPLTSGRAALLPCTEENAHYMAIQAAYRLHRPDQVLPIYRRCKERGFLRMPSTATGSVVLALQADGEYGEIMRLWKAGQQRGVQWHWRALQIAVDAADLSGDAEALPAIVHSAVALPARPVPEDDLLPDLKVRALEAAVGSPAVFLDLIRRYRAAGQGPLSAEVYLLSLRFFLRHREWREALIVYDELLATYPSLTPAHRRQAMDNKARAHLMGAQREEALRVIDALYSRPSVWGRDTVDAEAFERRITELVDEERWGEVLEVFLTLSSLQAAFVPSERAYHAAVQAGMELRDWTAVVVVWEKMRHYTGGALQRQRQEAIAKDVPHTRSPGKTRSRQDVDADEAAELERRWRRSVRLAVDDSVMYAAYRMHRHDIVVEVFHPQALPSSHTTMLLSLGRERRWDDVRRFVEDVGEEVWGGMEMAVVHDVLTHMRGDEEGRAVYPSVVPAVSRLLMEVGLMSTPPLPLTLHPDPRFSRHGRDDAVQAVPLVVAPVQALLGQSTINSLANTVHYTDEENMRQAVLLALSLLPHAALCDVAVVPPPPQVTSMDVDDVVREVGMRGESGWLTRAEMRGVMAKSARRVALEGKEREANRLLFESKAERRRRLREEAEIKSGRAQSEKHWVLLLRADELCKLQQQQQQQQT